MPFQSEKQRRYLWANEPEIAREWTDRYGANQGGIMNWAGQGGMKNFLGEQPTVNAPKYWQSSPDHEMTELAYITPKERDVLVDMNMYGTMSGEPNEGPSGIMSLNGWGSSDRSQERSGQDISPSMDRGGGWDAPSHYDPSPNVPSYSTAQSPAQLQLLSEQAGSSTVMPESHYGRTYRQPGGVGNFFRSLGRGIGNVAMMFNPFTAAAGIMGSPKTAAFMNLLGRGKQNLKNTWSGFGEDVDEFGQYNTLADYFNRNKEPTIDDETRLAIMQDPDLQADIMKDFKIRNPLDLTPDYMHDQEAVPPVAFEHEGAIGNNQLADYIDINKSISSEHTDPIEKRISDTFGYDQDNISLATGQGNYAQNAVAQQVTGQSYGSLSPYMQQQINAAIDTYGTTSLGTLR